MIVLQPRHIFQLFRTDDVATATAYNGGFEFKDAVKQTDVYAYDKNGNMTKDLNKDITCLLYTSPSPRDSTSSRMPSSA